MEQLFSPFMQYGFAGLCFVLIGVICWLAKQILAVLKETNEVIAKNSATIDKLHTSTSRVETAINKLRDELLKRPCLATEDDARTG